MRILKGFSVAFLVLCAIFLIGGFLIPAEWTVSRSITIQASAKHIYPFVSNFTEWDKWSPWNSSQDPSIHYTYEGPKMGAGAKQSWTSHKMGTGWMQFTAANAHTGVSYDLFIDMGHSQSTLHGNIAFAHEGDGTKVTWTDHGDSGTSFIKRWMSLLLRPMLGKNFDTGLLNLKALVEKS